MARTFGQELLQLAQSVDIIDAGNLEHVRHLLLNYFRDVLRIDFWEVQQGGVLFERRPGMHTYGAKNSLWTNLVYNGAPIRTPDGKYHDQTTFAYETRTTLWVTEKHGDVLKEDSACVDHWPHNKHSTPLPPYWPFEKNMRTQIVFPLLYGDYAFGVLNLETERLLNYTPFAGEELKRVSDAISIILWLHDTNSNQTRGTRTAIENVSQTLTTGRNPLVKPRVFVASASRADDQVVGIIHRVISEFGNEAEEVFWRSFTESGNVNTQLLAAIEGCSLGVCYFSEPAPAGHGNFVDNLNVVFEAGMLHALTSAGTGAPKKWIPIRERQSPATPFDFASERTVVVPRLADGTLNEELFARDLRSRLATAFKG